jgi:topoisomerase-4 subunit A
VAYLNLDEVIRIIRSEDEPKPVLITRFDLSDAQAEAILQLRLRHLAKLEEMKIRSEQQALDKERQFLEATLGSPARLKTLIKKELRADAKTHGDDRRTAIVQRQEAQAISEEQLAPVEPVTVILSANGWVRAAKGHEIDPSEAVYRPGDRYLDAARGKSNQPAVFSGRHRADIQPVSPYPAVRTGLRRAANRPLCLAARRHLHRRNHGAAPSAIADRQRCRLRVYHPVRRSGDA